MQNHEKCWSMLFFSNKLAKITIGNSIYITGNIKKEIASHNNKVLTWPAYCPSTMEYLHIGEKMGFFSILPFTNLRKPTLRSFTQLQQWNIHYIDVFHFELYISNVALISFEQSQVLGDLRLTNLATIILKLVFIKEERT